MRNPVAIVDGDAANRSQLTDALRLYYRTTRYADPAAATTGMLAQRPLAIVVGEQLPNGGGFTFVRALRQNPEFRHVPIIVLAEKNDLHSRDMVRYSGADCGLYKPYQPAQMTKVIADLINAEVEGQWHFLAPVQSKALTGTVEIFNRISDCIDKGEPIAYHAVADACTPLVEAVRTQDFKTMLNAVRNHDNYTYVHSLRIATLLTLFGRTIGLSENDQLLLASGGLLHDVGKMYIPHDILNKPGRLTPDEFSVMKTHVDLTLRYLAGYSELPRGIVTIAGQHHEKINGDGYPNGLAGGQLNELARMAAIVDVFGALTDRRVYKPSMPAEEALAIMREKMPGHLDLPLLHLFREMLLDTAT